MLLFETIKCMIRGETIKYSAYKRKLFRYNVSALEEKIKLLEEEYIKHPTSEKTYSE